MTRKETSVTPHSCFCNYGVLFVSVMCSLIRINGEKSKMTVLPGVGRK